MGLLWGSALLVFTAGGPRLIASKMGFLRVRDESKYSSLQLRISDEYGTLSTLNYDWLADALLMAPFKASTISVVETMDGCDYDFKFQNETEALFSIHSVSSSYVDVTANFTGWFTVSVKELCDSEITRTLQKKIFVKYIRRELRSLSASDRNSFLTALWTLYNVHN